MDHVVYLDSKAKEFESLKLGKKKMIIRSATGRKMPYGRVNKDDSLYFMNNNGDGKVIAFGKVKTLFESEKLSKEDSVKLVEDNQDKLQLTDKQFAARAGKRYIILIEIGSFKEVEAFEIDRSEFGNMDDWLPVENISKVKK